MATGQLNTVLRSLRRGAWLGEGEGPTDGQLLEAYRTRREEAPFEALVRRHGPMVWGVCRRILRHAQDAEDAFQATFLVLVRKASSIKPAGMVGNWLHGVAYRTAMKARADFCRRKRQEKELSRPEAVEAVRNRALELLDQEIDHLPEKYRAPLVLCDLEGKTRTEAARHLGWPEGTVAGRLSRARAMLAGRLRRRGLAVCGGTLALDLARLTATAAVPGRLVVDTLKFSTIFAIGKTGAGGIPANVFALTNGVLKTMLLNRLKLASVVIAVVLAGLVSTTAGLLSQRSLAAGDQQSSAPPAQEADRSGTPHVPRARHPQLQGIWSLTHAERDGKRLTVERDSVHLVVTNRFWIWEERGKDRAFTYRLAGDTRPKAVDLTCLDEGGGKGKTILGIYAIEGDALTVCESDGARPSRFSAQAGSGCTLFVYKRVAAVSASGTAPAAGFGGSGLSEKSEDKDVMVTNKRSIRIPVNVPADAREKIKEIRLLTSADRGKVWRVSSFASLPAPNVPLSDEVCFTFEAPKNGLYWFAVQMVHRDGTVSPKDPKAASPTLKIRVNTAETPAPELAPESPAPWANKLFDAMGPLTYDFGNLPSGTQREHRFPLKNVYNVPLDITNVRTSCSCVTVRPGANRLKPHEVGFIHVTIDARRFRGPKTVAIHITFGSDYVSSATLHVSANAVGEAEN